MAKKTSKVTGGRSQACKSKVRLKLDGTPKKAPGRKKRATTELGKVEQEANTRSNIIVRQRRERSSVM